MLINLAVPEVTSCHQLFCSSLDQLENHIYSSCLSQEKQEQKHKRWSEAKVEILMLNSGREGVLSADSVPLHESLTYVDSVHAF